MLCPKKSTDCDKTTQEAQFQCKIYLMVW